LEFPWPIATTCVGKHIDGGVDGIVIEEAVDTTGKRNAFERHANGSLDIGHVIGNTSERHATAILNIGRVIGDN